MSILVLAVGVLAVTSVQVRTLAETQTSVRRGQAIRAIEGMAELIKAKPGGFGQIRAGSYASDWNTDTASTDDGCSSKVCSPGEFSHSDLMRWKSNLAEPLPMGKRTCSRLPMKGLMQPMVDKSVSWLVGTQMSVPMLGPTPFPQRIESMPLASSAPRP